MRKELERAIRQSEYTAGLFSELGEGISEIKKHGGIGDAEKLEALQGFRTRALEIIQIWGSVIDQSIREYNAYVEQVKNEPDCVSSTLGGGSLVCVVCGEGNPKHKPDCSVLGTMKKQC